jgi:hypothetical protein
MSHAAIVWGNNSGPFATLRIATCAGSPHSGDAYAGALRLTGTRGEPSLERTARPAWISRVARNVPLDAESSTLACRQSFRPAR